LINFSRRRGGRLVSSTRKYAISDRMGEGARAAGEAAKRGAETMASSAERLRAEAERLAEDEEMGDTARLAASGVKKASQVMRDVAGDAGKKAGEVFDEAKTYYGRASQFYDAGAKLTRASTAATAGVLKARDWIKENPGKAAVVSVSLVLGYSCRRSVSWFGCGAVGRAPALADAFGAAGLGIAQGERKV
jgi:hypothetical protein